MGDKKEGVFKFLNRSKNKDYKETNDKVAKIENNDRELLDQIEQYKRQLKVMESAIKEREFLLSHHEKKVLEFKANYEKKLAHLENVAKIVGSKEREIENQYKSLYQTKKLEVQTKGVIKSSGEEHRSLLAKKDKLNSEILQLSKRLDELSRSEKKLVEDFNRKEKEHAEKLKRFISVDQKQKEFEELKNSIENNRKVHAQLNLDVVNLKIEKKNLEKSVPELRSQKSKLTSDINVLSKKLTEILAKEKQSAQTLSVKDKQILEKQKILDMMISKIKTSSEYVAAKNKENEDIKKNIALTLAKLQEANKSLKIAENKHDQLIKQISTKSLNETERLITKAHEHLKKGEITAASANYERLRELYKELSHEKKVHMYKKISDLAKKLESYLHFKNFSS